MFVVDQCDEADNGQGRGDHDYHFDFASDHNGTTDHHSAHNHDPAASDDSPASEHDPIGSGSGVLADDVLGQLLQARRTLL